LVGAWRDALGARPGASRMDPEPVYSHILVPLAAIKPATSYRIESTLGGGPLDSERGPAAGIVSKSHLTCCPGRQGKEAVDCRKGAINRTSRITESAIRRYGIRTRPWDARHRWSGFETQVRKGLRRGTTVEAVSNSDGGHLLIRRNGEGNRRPLRRRSAPLAIKRRR
jgi:hypothetical protein